MVFEKEKGLYAVEVERKEGENIMYVNYMQAPMIPSIAEDPGVMARTVDELAKNPNVARVVFVQQRNYNYGFEQVAFLSEIARLYNFLIKQEELLSPGKLQIFGSVGEIHGDLVYLLNLLKGDPIGCYLELKSRIMVLRKQLDSGNFVNKGALVNYVRLLERFQGLLESTRLIKKFIGVISDYGLGNRELYKEVFRPDVLPNFTFTRLVSQLPSNAEFVDQYEIKGGDESVNVTILKNENDSKYFYHVMPSEYSLSEEHYLLLNLARNVLTEHRPKSEEFTDPERTRQVFYNVSRDLLQELSRNKGISLSNKELSKLASILVRHTIGFGLIEILLMDEKLQDIVLNAPIAQNAIFVRHSEYDECVTNIIPSYEDADSWAAKLRLQSGRPLDEANPVLDADLVFSNSRARVAAITKPLSPHGLAYAFRRHRDEPWTLPLFVKNKMINSFAAGLMSFLTDGARTMLVAGTRSSGKCVDGNTLIQLSDGGIKKIENMIGKEKNNIDDGVICDPISEMNVQTLDDMKINTRKIMDVWKRSSPEKVVKIRTRSGKEIITTQEHPYFVYNNGLKNKRAGELSRGELIASPRLLNLSGEEISIDLKDSPYFFEETREFFLLKGKTNSSIVKFPKKVTPELAEFIGLIVGDGHLNLTKLEFHNSSEDLRRRYISMLKMFDVPYRTFKSHTTTVVQVSCRVLDRVLNEVFEIPFGKKADKVVIPQLILKSNKIVLAAFLRGYFDADGYIPKGKRDIELATASKLMSEQLQLALLRFGITTFNKPRKINESDYYRILIRGDFVKKFAKHIGFYSSFKKERLDSIMSKTFLETTNVDVIPNGNEILRKLRKALRISPKEFRSSGKDYWAYENDQYRVSRKWFGKIIDFFDKRCKEVKSMKYRIEYLRAFLDFDIEKYLDEVEATRKELGMSYVKVAKEVGLSERGVRKILQNKVVGGVSTLQKVMQVPLVFENYCKVNDMGVGNVINQFTHGKILVDSVKLGIILSNLRNDLNLSNEELARSGVSVGTVSNIFNGVYTPSLMTLRKIASKILEVYNEVISFRTLSLLNEAMKLANSDIFWDEIFSVELIDKVDNFVYDLTVEDTHNFVANGLIAHNTSLLGSLMLEIMQKFRIVLLEDTLELPADTLRKIGYDILRMKVRSALVKGTTEVEASEGIRTSLRLGDSALIVGEVRSTEAKALYEAMRIGALANVVAGTIHGDSPYGVFDRVVNDLEVPATSFKATDVIIVANPVKTADGLHSKKRVVGLTEVRKHWEKDPALENGFVDLLRYNVEKDELEPTEELINGNSEVIKSIAGQVKGWAGDWDAVYDNILLRGKVKEEIVKTAEKLNKPEILEAKFNALSNGVFHRISDEVRKEIGLPMQDRVFPEWKKWLLKYGKKI